MAKEIVFSSEKTAYLVDNYDDPLDEAKELAAMKYGLEPSNVDVFWTTPEQKSITALVYL